MTGTDGSPAGAPPAYTAIGQTYAEAELVLATALAETMWEDWFSGPPSPSQIQSAVTDILSGLGRTATDPENVCKPGFDLRPTLSV